MPLHLKQTFLSIIWIFTEAEGDGIESKATFYICIFYFNYVDKRWGGER